MIITVTLNPAIDKTVYIDEFKVDEVNRIKRIRKDVGGKGINVSQNLKNLEKENLCLTILGGDNGEFIKNNLKEHDIKFDYFQVKDDVRVNLKVVDLKENTFTDINEPGFEIREDLAKNIINEIVKKTKENDILVLSGSVPKGFNTKVYRRIIEKIDSHVILDTSGELLKEGIKGKPYLIKPNIEELNNLFDDREITSENDVINASKKLIKSGIKIVAVSLGSKGSIYITKDKVLKIEGKKVKVKSTVGAGDSMVAALAMSLDEGFSIEKMAEYASAVSTASIMTEGSQPGSLDVINKMINYGGKNEN